MSTVFVYAQLNVKTVLFQTIQLSISTQFSSIGPKIEPDQVLPLRVRMYLRLMAIKEYPDFLKTQAILEPHHHVI